MGVFFFFLFKKYTRISSSKGTFIYIHIHTHTYIHVQWSNRDRNINTFIHTHTYTHIRDTDMVVKLKRHGRYWLADRWRSLELCGKFNNRRGGRGGEEKREEEREKINNGNIVHKSQFQRAFLCH